MLSCSFWFDSDLLWENPKDVRPYHVQTPWYWFPDSDVAEAMIKVKSVSAELSISRFWYWLHLEFALFTCNWHL